ncbi:MAG TPA: antibiotic transporter [Cyanobacteria bacterium UBA11369]|nr:antibiotic transporter [Cyanobacteria bacterium UBA11371]HBE36209.1 antibiotic transporter [Cyanobacteria bacterium UBA11368]HBE51943.1 antibiotic transporter [Cyanobacteria bacterium UBA11369]
MISLEEKPEPSALTARAVAAAVSVATAHGVSIDDPQVIADAYSVRIHLKPAPIVARVSTITAILRSGIESWLLRELSVAEFLASKGAPVIPPSDILPPGAHYYDGLFMTFWRYFQPVSDALPESAIVGRMLAELHAVLRDYPGDLPLLAPPLNDIPRGLERIERVGDILPASDLRLLQETYDKLLPQLHNSASLLQPLHGDANALNLIPTAEGLLWNDFEDTCRGAIAWDLINLDDEGRAAYPDAPDSATLEPYIKMRQLHGIVWVYALLPEFPNWVAHVKVMLDDLRERSQRLH